MKKLLLITTAVGLLAAMPVLAQLATTGAGPSAFGGGGGGGGHQWLWNTNGVMIWNAHGVVKCNAC